MRRRDDALPGRLLLALPLLTMFVAIGLPLAAVIYFSLDQLGIAGSMAAILDPTFISAFLRTLLVAGCVTAGVLVVGTFYALCLELSPRAVRIALFLVLFINFSISPLVRTYGWVLLFQPRGALDAVGQWFGIIEDSFVLSQSLTSMFPAMIHTMLPFGVLPLFASLRAIPVNQFRAARSLGASPLVILTSIVIPQLRGGATAGGLLVFVLSLGFFITPQLLGGPRDVLLATIIFRTFEVLLDPAGAAAMSIFALVLVLALYALGERLFRISSALDLR